jgi:hypothetical protein
MNAFDAIARSLSSRPAARFEVPNSKGGPKPKIPMGTRFGRWTVIGYVPGHRNAQEKIKPRYTCRCECGTVRDVLGSGLTRGMSKSCGCLTGRWRIPPGEST